MPRYSVDQSVYDYIIDPEELRAVTEKEVTISLEHMARLIRNQFLGADKDDFREKIKICASQTPYLYHTVKNDFGSYKAGLRQLREAHDDVKKMFGPLIWKLEDLRELSNIERGLERDSGFFSEGLRDPKFRAKVLTRIKAIEAGEDPSSAGEVPARKVP